jgi:hypothetical protein
LVLGHRVELVGGVYFRLFDLCFERFDLGTHIDALQLESLVGIILDGLDLALERFDFSIRNV